MKKLFCLMILVPIVAMLLSGCAPKRAAYTEYFILTYQNEYADMIACSEETFLNFCPKVETQVGRMRVDYSEDSTYTAAFEWLYPPDGDVIRIVVGNSTEPDHPAFLEYEVKCRGVSDNADLNHIYTSKRVCYDDEKSPNAPVMKVIDTAASEIVYAIDFSRISPCSYYAEPAISTGMFSEHSVVWNKLQFTCEGRLSDLNKKLFFEIYM